MEAVGREYGYVPGRVTVGGEVGSNGVRHPHCSDLVQRSGGDTVIWFCMPAQTWGEGAYSVGGGVLWRRRRRKEKSEKIVRKCNE